MRFSLAMKSRFVLPVYCLAAIAAVSLSPIQRAQAGEEYPEVAVEAFTKACSEQAIKDGAPTEMAKQVCACSIAGFQKAFTIDEFMKISTDVQAGKPMPTEMMNIVGTCSQHAK